MHTPYVFRDIMKWVDLLKKSSSKETLSKSIYKLMSQNPQDILPTNSTNYTRSLVQDIGTRVTTYADL
jgi:putative component of toxin-antitoxin plasmid stabilization module